MTEVTPDDHLYDHVLHLTSGGDGIRASISDDRIVIEDRGDGHFVVINSEQARRLQQWLAEMERLKMSEPSDKLCNDASQSTRPATPEAGGLLTSNGLTYWYIQDGCRHEISDRHEPPSRGWTVFVLASEYDRLQKELAEAPRIDCQRHRR